MPALINKRGRELLGFLREFRRSHGEMPSLAQMREEMGWARDGVVDTALRDLESAGAVRRVVQPSYRVELVEAVPVAGARRPRVSDRIDEQSTLLLELAVALAEGTIRPQEAATALRHASGQLDGCSELVARTELPADLVDAARAARPLVFEGGAA